MSRRPTGQAVSLFPFLAVLISAMGALILLLLVTTRKLHNDAVSRAKAEQALVQAQREADAEAALKAVPLPLPADHPAFQTDAAEFVIAIQAPSKKLLPPAPPPEPDRSWEKERLRKEWEAKTAALRDNWERLQQRLREAQRLLSDRAQQEADLAAELARLQEAINMLRADKGEIAEDVEKAKTTKKSIAQQIAELQSELERLKAEKASQADKFQLVPYAGASPTRRRPIIIECRANTISFASEEIPLSARDMSGFSPDYNPVRAGTTALLEYWEAQRQAATSLAAMQPQPYLLFVIRPGGTVSYYVTRRMLEGLPVDSGYELVTQSQEMVWPVSTPEAKAACQEAIDEALGMRNRMTAQTPAPDGRLPVAHDLQYEGQNGEFVLEEVQKLRNPAQKTFVGNQRITRHERPRGGIPGYKPPTAPEGSGGFVGPKLEDLKDEMGNLPPRRSAASDSVAGDHRPGEARPFHTDPPPRIGRSGTGSNAGPAGNETALIPPGSMGPVRPLPPNWKSQHAGAPADPDRMTAMTPTEVQQHLNAPSSPRGPVGKYSAEGQQDAGRGAGESSGEATSQFADRGAVNDLLASGAKPSNQQPWKPHDPTNAVNAESNSPAAAHDGTKQGQRAGQPGGDRTSAVETTDDPSKAGESKPEGVAGGKGTFSGDGPSGAAAPDTIPVQPGGTGGPAGSKGKPDSTDQMLTHHLPRPLPEPPANSITAERYVVVTVDSSHIQIGSHQIAIEEGMSSLDLKKQFSKELGAAAKRWGRAPAGFHWQPALRFRVRPGGNQYYAWLQSASQEWELKNTVEYVFD